MEYSQPREGEERGLPSPCLGLGKDRTNDNVRGRHRWHAEALLSLKRGLYSILFARLKKILLLLRERHRQRELERDLEREREKGESKEKGSKEKKEEGQGHYRWSIARSGDD